MKWYFWKYKFYKVCISFYLLYILHTILFIISEWTWPTRCIFYCTRSHIPQPITFRATLYVGQFLCLWISSFINPPLCSIITEYIQMSETNFTSEHQNTQLYGNWMSGVTMRHHINTLYINNIQNGILSITFANLICFKGIKVSVYKSTWVHY